MSLKRTPVTPAHITIGQHLVSQSKINQIVADQEARGIGDADADPVTASGWLQAQKEDLADPVRAFHRDNQEPSTGALPIYTEVKEKMSQSTPTPAPRLNLVEDKDGAPLPDQDQAKFQDMTDWWVTNSEADAVACIKKAVEYGSADIDIMAHSLLAMSGATWDHITDPDERLRIGREMAVTTYLQGKLGRIMGAMQKGRLPSDDTLHDITVYSMMLRYVRQFGAWA